MIELTEYRLGVFKLDPSCVHVGYSLGVKEVMAKESNFFLSNALERLSKTRAE